MKRVLQHGKTGLYVGIDGSLTPDFARAWAFPTIRDAMVVCTRLNYLATDFVYRVLEPGSPWFAPELVHPRPRSAVSA